MRIAIVGGGAATISLLDQFIRLISKEKQAGIFYPHQVEIYLIEKNDEIGPGLAYSTFESTHLLNLPAKTMSPIPNEPRHFLDWAVSNKALWEQNYENIDIHKCDYPPRSLYGLYLKSLFNFLIKKGREIGIIIHTLAKHEVVNIIKEDQNQFNIIFSDEKKSPLFCNKIILSLGHLESDKYYEYKSSETYIHSPWNLDDLKKIPHSASIFIAGTRLTAIDASFALKSFGHQGKIILGSKFGLLPCVIGKLENSFTRKILTYEKIIELTAYGTIPLELSHLLDLFSAEFETGSGEKFDLDKFITPYFSARALLKKEIKEVRQGKSRHWQNILFSLYPNISFIWNLLSEESKKYFLDNYYSAWMTYLAAFPLESAERIFSLLKKKEVEVKRGLQKIVYDKHTSKFIVTFNNEILRFDYFINGTGAGHNISKIPSPLLQNMLKNDLLLPHSLGGVKIDFKTLQPISKGLVTGLFMIGDSLTFGTCLATADLSQSAKQATRIVYTLLNQMKAEIKNKHFAVCSQ